MRRDVCTDLVSRMANLSGLSSCGADSLYCHTALGHIRISRKDTLIFVGEIALFCVILGSAVVTSWGTIQSMLHTAYPGARQSIGGGLPPLSLISSVGTLFFPFKDYAVDSVTTNMVEASRFVDLFPLG